MVKNKKNSKNEMPGKKTSSKNKFSPLILILLGVLVIVVIFMLAGKDKKMSDISSSELEILSNNCLAYANAASRADFCRYNLIDGELLNCRDSRVLDFLESKGIDTTIGSLNCKGIDVYSYRKDVCSSLAYGKPETRIADTTCADYQ